MFSLSHLNFWRIYSSLGNSLSVKYSVYEKEISSEALEIGEMEGVKLEDRYVGGAQVYSKGRASIEKLLQIYQE